LYILVAIESCEVCIGITVDPSLFGWFHDHAHAHGAFEVATNANECQFVTVGWIERVASTLMNRERNVWA
jgi:hypothetical protein